MDPLSYFIPTFPTTQTAVDSSEGQQPDLRVNYNPIKVDGKTNSDPQCSVVSLISNAFSRRYSFLFSVWVPPQAPWSPSWEFAAWMGWCYSNIFLPLCPSSLLALYGSDARSSQGVTDSQTHPSSSLLCILQPAETPHCFFFLMNRGFQPQRACSSLSSLIPIIKDKFASFSFS